MIPVVTALVVLSSWVLTQPSAHKHPVMAQPKRRAESLVDLAVTCDLLCAALHAGASLPRACETVGVAADRGQLRTAARALHLGASWEEAWGGYVLGEVLAPAWTDGADPTPLLEQLARSIRANRRTAARAAAARLSVQLVLPVGLCLLPAFILVGVVPMLVSGSLRILG